MSKKFNLAEMVEKKFKIWLNITYANMKLIKFVEKNWLKNYC